MNTFKTNPLGFCYGPAPRSMERVVEFAKPTAMFVTGRTNPFHPDFQIAREKGAEVLRYWDIPERPNSPSNEDKDMYPGNCPLWGKGRASYPNHMLTDMRVDSDYVDNWVLPKAEELMKANRWDGFFLDVVGTQLWSKAAAFNAWPVHEQDAWADGNVDLLRKLDKLRRRVNPKFILVSNNTLVRRPFAEAFVDGICSEEHLIENLAMQRLLGRPFSDLGHRRVLVISPNAADAKKWANVQGVTHITAATEVDYAKPTPPVVGYNDLRKEVEQPPNEPPVAELIVLRAKVKELENELDEADETKRLLGKRVDVLTAKLKSIEAKVEEEMQGVD